MQFYLCLLGDTAFSVSRFRFEIPKSFLSITLVKKTKTKLSMVSLYQMQSLLNDPYL